MRDILSSFTFVHYNEVVFSVAAPFCDLTGAAVGMESRRVGSNGREGVIG